ncbi:DUF3300 domain-containing protein [Escherichia coli]
MRISTAQIDQWVAPVALYPDSLLSQVLMASTYPANVAERCDGWRVVHLNKAMLLFRRYLTSRGTPAAKSLVAFPQLMALIGAKPAMGQKRGDAASRRSQDVMDSVQRLRQLAQQTSSLK